MKSTFLSDAYFKAPDQRSFDFDHQLPVDKCISEYELKRYNKFPLPVFNCFSFGISKTATASDTLVLLVSVTAIIFVAFAGIAVCSSNVNVAAFPELTMKPFPSKLLPPNRLVSSSFNLLLIS